MASIPVRVMVLDTWGELPLTVDETTPIGELKRSALAEAHVRKPAAQYQVKFRGAAVPEDGETVASAGIVPNAALIVLPRRRIPAR